MGTDGWSVVVSTEKYSVSRRKIENQPVELVSGRFRMSIPPSRAFDIFYDPALRQQWDTNTTDFEIVDKIDDRNDVLLQRVRMPNPLGPRESLNSRFSRRADDEKNMPGLIAWRACVHAKVPIVKKPIRIWSMGSYLFEPMSDPSECLLKFAIVSDPGGSLPKWLVNMVAPRILLRAFRRIEDIFAESIKRRPSLC